MRFAKDAAKKQFSVVTSLVKMKSKHFNLPWLLLTQSVVVGNIATKDVTVEHFSPFLDIGFLKNMRSAYFSSEKNTLYRAGESDTK